MCLWAAPFRVTYGELAYHVERIALHEMLHVDCGTRASSISESRDHQTDAFVHRRLHFENGRHRVQVGDSAAESGMPLRIALGEQVLEQGVGIA